MILRKQAYLKIYKTYKKENLHYLYEG